MVHTAECVAPEGNQDRDEWITVIEMQEYMRASRNKAYGLIWSGEIDSYRTPNGMDKKIAGGLPRHLEVA